MRRQGWEYLRVSWEDIHDDHDELNRLGADGWELVTILSDGWVFKRPLEGDVEG